MSRDLLDREPDVRPDPALAVCARVAAISGVGLVALLGPDRHKKNAQARHVAIWAVREQVKLSYPAIGRLFGNRDHRTIMYSCERVQVALAGGDQGLAELARRAEDPF